MSVEGAASVWLERTRGTAPEPVGASETEEYPGLTRPRHGQLVEGERDGVVTQREDPSEVNCVFVKSNNDFTFVQNSAFSKIYLYLIYLI